MNLANKYIDAEDVESVEQLRNIFEKGRDLGHRCDGDLESMAVGWLKAGSLRYIQFDNNKNVSVAHILCAGMPEGYTRIYPRDLLGNCTTQGHPRAPLLCEIASAMDEDPDGWWTGFYYETATGWVIPVCEEELWNSLKEGITIEKRHNMVSVVSVSGEVPVEVMGIAENIIGEHNNHGVVGADELELAQALLDLREVDDE